MRIVAVEAQAFGPFIDRRLDLTPGFNIVVGPNEAGKSSWHAAIHAGLCGVRRGVGGRTLHEREFVARHQPWEGDAWRVVLVIELDDGSQLELRQDLGGDSASTVTDLATGRDLTGELFHDGAPDAARLLGLTRGTLPSTLSVRQAEILRVLENPSELQKQLQRAAATGGADETAQAAIDALKAFRLEGVGPVRKGSRRPLALALEAVAVRRKELEAARTDHQDFLSLVDMRQQADERADTLGRELERVRREIDRRDLEGFRHRVERAGMLDASLPEGEPPDPRIWREELTEVATVLGESEGCPPEPRPLGGAGVDELVARLEAIPSLPTAETEPAAELESGREAWLAARHVRRAQESTALATGRKPKTGDAGAAELRELAAALEEPRARLDSDLAERVAELRQAARRRARGGGEMPKLVGGTVLAIGGIALLVLEIKLPGLVAVAIGVVVMLLAWRSQGTSSPELEELPALEARLAGQRQAGERSEAGRSTAEERARELDLRPESATLRRLAGELETFEALAVEREAWELRLTGFEEAEQEAAAAWRSALVGHLDSDPGDLDAEALWSRYRDECAVRSRQAEAARQRESVEQQLRSRRAAEAAVAADQEARAAVTGKLNAIASRLGWPSGDSAGEDSAAPEVLVAWLREWQRDREGGLERLAADRETWAGLQEILGERSLAELEAELERRQDELSTGSEIDPPAAVEELKPARRRLEREWADATGERDRLAGRIADRSRDLVVVAEAEEAMARADSELARVQALDATLGRTLGFLEASRDEVQRDIAPRLAAKVNAHLGAVTQGRYTEAVIDPATLNIRVRAAGQPWREARHLSHGTAEQIYLLLRLALADLLVTTDETAPLLLDDVTVQSDTPRTRAILDQLHAVSQGRQVILFSQEDEVREWAAEHLSESVDRLIELSI